MLSQLHASGKMTVDLLAPGPESRVAALRSKIDRNHARPRPASDRYFIGGHQIFVYPPTWYQRPPLPASSTASSPAAPLSPSESNTAGAALSRLPGSGPGKESHVGLTVALGSDSRAEGSREKRAASTEARRPGSSTTGKGFSNYHPICCVHS